MPDWKSVASAYGLEIPPEDLERSLSVMDAIEKTFRPLAAKLSWQDEPAVTFSCPKEDK